MCALLVHAKCVATITLSVVFTFFLPEVLIQGSEIRVGELLKNTLEISAYVGGVTRD